MVRMGEEVQSAIYFTPNAKRGQTLPTQEEITLCIPRTLMSETPYKREPDWEERVREGNAA